MWGASGGLIEWWFDLCVGVGWGRCGGFGGGVTRVLGEGGWGGVYRCICRRVVFGVVCWCVFGVVCWCVCVGGGGLVYEQIADADWLAGVGVVRRVQPNQPTN